MLIHKADHIMTVVRDSVANVIDPHPITNASQ